jgi:hypothetical protein
MIKSRLLAARMLLGATMFWGMSAIAGGDRFEARIRMVPIGAAELATITGQGSASASLQGRHLVVHGNYQGLQGPATHAALHSGPVMGVRGAEFADLNIEHAPAGEFSATLELNRRQIEALRAGRIYIQIHSTAAPNGNLWGWLLEVKQ